MSTRELILFMYAGFWLVGLWGTYLVVLIVRAVRHRRVRRAGGDGPG